MTTLRVATERRLNSACSMEFWYRHERTVLILSVFSVIAYYKISIALNGGLGIATDGGYYTDIARHVRDGHGLVTSISVHHKGYRFFPHPTSIYPGWPLLYGYASRLSSNLIATGIWINTISYLGSLVFAYHWGNRLFPNRPNSALSSLSAGTLLVLVMGLNAQYFAVTSMPLTEGPSYFLLMLFLWRFSGRWSCPSLKMGLEMGVWLGVITLMRTQLMLVALAALPILFAASVLASSERRQYMQAAVGAAATFLGLLSVQLWWVRTFIPDAELFEVLQFNSLQATRVLSPLNHIASFGGVEDWLKDKWSGVLEGFSLKLSPYSYMRAFHAFQYAVLFAPIILIGHLAGLWRRTSMQSAIAAIRKPNNLHLVFTVVFAVGALVSLHAIHKTISSAWWFGRRHSMPCTFAFFLSLLLLCRQRWMMARAIAMVLIGYSVFSGWKVMHERLEESKRENLPARTELVSWLKDAQVRDQDTLIVVARNPQHLAIYTEGIGYHHFMEKTSADDIVAMFTELGADYLILKKKARYKFWNKKTAELFTHVATVSNEDIYTLKREIPASTEESIPPIDARRLSPNAIVQ